MQCATGSARRADCSCWTKQLERCYTSSHVQMEEAVYVLRRCLYLNNTYNSRMLRGVQYVRSLGAARRTRGGLTGASRQVHFARILPEQHHPTTVQHCFACCTLSKQLIESLSAHKQTPPGGCVLQQALCICVACPVSIKMLQHNRPALCAVPTRGRISWRTPRRWQRMPLC